MERRRMSKQKRKAWKLRENSRGPQGAGPCARDEEYRTRDLGLASGPSRSVMRLFRSHEIPGVMLGDLSIVQEERRIKARKIVFESNREDIVTLPHLL